MPLDVIGEGPVSTSDRPYQSGRSKHWIKFKNRKHLFINPFERDEIGPDLFRAATRSPSAATLGPMIFGCPISEPILNSPVRLARFTLVHG
jgi:hypothetical protein